MATNLYPPNGGGLSSVMSFPNRGPWGNPRWRGNTSGHPIKRLVEHFKPKVFVDPAEGSGTSRDVAEELRRKGMPIEYYGFDLHSGFNLLKDRLVERLPREADYVFFHPPYAGLISYSGNVWGDEPHPDDLSRCESYEDFLSKLERSLFNVFDATTRGGVYSVMVADVRSKGRYYALQADIVKMAPGKLEGIIIKEQHNCTSDARAYSGSFIPIRHEYIINMRRDGIVFGMLDATLDISSRLRTLSDATWDALVEHALRRLGGEAELQSIYKVIEETAPDHTAQRPNWEAKVRQRLHFKHRNTQRGRWALAA